MSFKAPRLMSSVALLAGFIATPLPVKAARPFVQSANLLVPPRPAGTTPSNLVSPGNTAPGAPITEVIVTAQKRAEPLNRTPISMIVVSGDDMRKAQAHDLKDLQYLTPSLFVTSTANEGQTTARLRGVGTVGDNPGLDSSVGVVIDGVARARTATALGDLGMLDRIEILKGPQSDVYGKGASAGLIQVVTRLPDFKPSSNLELTTGSQNALGASAYLTGRLIGNLAGSLNFTSRRRDGQYHVQTGAGPRSETSDNNENYDSLRGQLLLVTSDKASFRLIADYTRKDESCCTGVNLLVGGTHVYIDQLAGGIGTATVANLRSRVAWSNRSTRQVVLDSGVSAQIDLALNDYVQLTSITAARGWNQTGGYDADFTSADIYYRDPNGGFSNRFHTYSQEIRLNGKTRRLNWMLGGYLNKEDLVRHDETLYGKDYESYLSLLLSGGSSLATISNLTGLPIGQSYVAGQGNHDLYQQTERNSALFGHADWFITDSLTLLGGVRLNHQDKGLLIHFSNSDGGRACSLATSALGVLCLPWSNPAFNALSLQQKGSENASTGSLRLKWQIDPSRMTYLSYATGWKGAGYNLDREQMANTSVNRDSSFRAETSRSYEAGFKGRWMENRLSLNMAAFDEAFRHFQLNTFLGTTFVVDSIPNLRSHGAEIDGRYFASQSPSGNLILSGGLTYDEARFGKEAVAGLPLLSNGTAAFAPKWSSVFGIDYGRAIGDLKLGLTLTGKMNSAYNTGSDLNPVKLQKAYTLYGGRISVGAPDDHWSLELWGQNLTDALYYQVAFAAPFQAGTYDAFLGQPRTVGLTLRLRR